MSDIYSRSKRSEIMSKISGKETKPEIFVRKFLFSRGFRYRKNVKELPGKPDIVLPKYKTVIFINGCFWHGHDCKRGKLPKSNYDFWASKIERNIQHDLSSITELKKQGWQVIVVWQCEIRNEELKQNRMTSLLNEVLGTHI